MNIEVVRARTEDKHVIRNLMQLYLHDYAEFDEDDVDEHGLYNYNWLDQYWIETDIRHPFIVRVDGKLAGFVLIGPVNYVDGLNEIAEFFIVRKYRNKGVGKAVAHQIFDLFPGPWRVQQHTFNLPAMSFWPRIISEYTDNNFRTWTDDHDHCYQEFMSRTKKVEP